MNEDVITVLNDAIAKIVSVGMNPDFTDHVYGDSPWLPATQEEACSLVSKAVRMLES